MSECRVCGGAVRPAGDAGGVPLGACSNCGSVQRILSEAAYAALEPTYDPGQDMEKASEEELFRALDIPKKEKILADLIALLPAASRPPRLIDIGCGVGAYLLAGRELGAAVLGIEPSVSHSRIGRERFGLEIRSEYFGESTFPPDRQFDIIMLSHVIEHIHRPGPFMTLLGRHVAPGGLIHLVTPNAGSLAAKLSGPDWTMLAPIDHVTMMTPRAMEHITPAGFDCTLSTDEYLWEPAMTLALGVRNRMSRRAHAASGTDTKPYGASARDINANLHALRLLASALSLPVWPVNQALKAGSTIVANYQKRSAH